MENGKVQSVYGAADTPCSLENISVSARKMQLSATHLHVECAECKCHIIFVMFIHVELRKLKSPAFRLLKSSSIKSEYVILAPRGVRGSSGSFAIYVCSLAGWSRGDGILESLAIEAERRGLASVSLSLPPTRARNRGKTEENRYSLVARAVAGKRKTTAAAAQPPRGALRGKLHRASRFESEGERTKWCGWVAQDG